MASSASGFGGATVGVEGVELLREFGGAGQVAREEEFDDIGWRCPCGRRR